MHQIEVKGSKEDIHDAEEKKKGEARRKHSTKEEPRPTFREEGRTGETGEDGDSSKKCRHNNRRVHLHRKNYV